MVSTLVKGFLAVAMFTMAYVHTPVYLDSQSFDKPRSYIHKIYRADGGSGSIVVVAPGMALTAAHVAVIPDLLVNGKPTKVLKINEDLDVALIQVALDCPCAPLGETPLVGDKVVAVGWSNGELEFATSGIVQGWKDNKLYSDTPIVFGNSGGGLFSFQDGQWKLVGITIQVSGVGLGFFGIPVFHMTRSVSTQNIIDFIGYRLDMPFYRV